MLKRLSVVILLAVFVTVFSACGDNGGSHGEYHRIDEISFESGANPTHFAPSEYSASGANIDSATSDNSAEATISDSETVTSSYVVIVEFGKYDWIGEFSDGLAVVNVGGIQEENHTVPNGGQWGVIDKTGREIIPLSDRYYRIDSFFGGFATVTDADGNTGVIDASGTEIIPLSDRFRWIWGFSDGIAIVFDADSNVGVIDPTGREIVPMGRYVGIHRASGGVLQVSVRYGESTDFSNLRHGIIDTDGNEIIPPIYTRIGSGSSSGFYYDVAIVYDGEWSAGLINSNGEIVVPVGTFNSIFSFSHGVAEVRGGGRIDNGTLWGGESGAIDTMGRVIIPLGRFGSIGGGWGFSDGVAVVRDSMGNLGIIDTSGREILPLSDRYNRINRFSEGVAVVSRGDWPYAEIGVIDSSGVEIIPLSRNFANISEFTDGVAIITGDVEMEDGFIISFESGVINKAGEIIVPFGRYSSIAVTPDGSWMGFSDGMTLVSVGSVFDDYRGINIGGEWGILDVLGRELVPPRFTWIEPFSEGVARVNIGTLNPYQSFPQGGQWGVISLVRP